MFFLLNRIFNPIISNSRNANLKGLKFGATFSNIIADLITSLNDPQKRNMTLGIFIRDNYSLFTTLNFREIF